jgi:sulfite reductase (NADPH) flavoprotein alpha-component
LGPPPPAPLRPPPPPPPPGGGGGGGGGPPSHNQNDHPGTKRLYLDKKFPTPDGRANFLTRDHREPREVPDHEFPFILTTGRLYSHWHTLTRTAKADKLTRREPGPFVEVNPHDAAKLKLEDGDMVQVSSRRGTIQLPARLRDGVSPGMIFVPFHWGDIYNDGNSANYLTIAAIGRVAKQPELKFCAVNLEKVPQAKKTIWPLPIALEDDVEDEAPLPAEAWIS